MRNSRLRIMVLPFLAQILVTILLTSWFGTGSAISARRLRPSSHPTTLTSAGYSTGSIRFASGSIPTINFGGKNEDKCSEGHSEEEAKAKKNCAGDSCSCTMLSDTLQQGAKMLGVDNAGERLDAALGGGYAGQMWQCCSRTAAFITAEASRALGRPGPALTSVEVDEVEGADPILPEEDKLSQDPENNKEAIAAFEAEQEPMAPVCAELFANSLIQGIPQGKHRYFLEAHSLTTYHPVKVWGKYLKQQGERLFRTALATVSGTAIPQKRGALKLADWQSSNTLFKDNQLELYFQEVAGLVHIEMEAEVNKKQTLNTANDGVYPWDEDLHGKTNDFYPNIAKLFEHRTADRPLKILSLADGWADVGAGPNPGTGFSTAINPPTSFRYVSYFLEEAKRNEGSLENFELDFVGGDYGDASKYSSDYQWTIKAVETGHANVGAHGKATLVLKEMDSNKLVEYDAEKADIIIMQHGLCFCKADPILAKTDNYDQNREREKKTPIRACGGPMLSVTSADGLFNFLQGVKHHLNPNNPLAFAALMSAHNGLEVLDGDQYESSTQLPLVRANEARKVLQLEEQQEDPLDADGFVVNPNAPENPDDPENPKAVTYNGAKSLISRFNRAVRMFNKESTAFRAHVLYFEDLQRFGFADSDQTKVDTLLASKWVHVGELVQGIVIISVEADYTQMGVGGALAAMIASEREDEAAVIDDLRG